MALQQPPSIVASLSDAGAAAERLSQLAWSCRACQLGAGAAEADFGGVAEVSAPSFELTCGAVWAWGAALRSCADRHDAAAVSELCDVARSAAWLFIHSRAAVGGLSEKEASALLLAAASERLLCSDAAAEDEDIRALALRAASVLVELLSAQPAVDSAWLVLPLLLYAHASSCAELQAQGRALALCCTGFPELPLLWWDAELPSGGLSAWAGSLVVSIVACQGEQELVPWCARVAASSLPLAFRAAGERSAAVWAHSASLMMALQALARALPRGWAPLRKAEKASIGLAASTLRLLDDACAGHPGDTLVARLAVSFALYGFSVDPGGGRVCC